MPVLRHTHAISVKLVSYNPSAIVYKTDRVTLFCLILAPQQNAIWNGMLDRISIFIDF